MENISNTLIELVSKHLHKKFNTDKVVKLAEEEPQRINALLDELSQAIATYNELGEKQEATIDPNFFQNTNHLRSIMPGKLPDWRDVLGQDEKFFNSVFARIASEKRLQEVWRITEPEALLGNVVVLAYRTGALIRNPDLEGKGAQFSSVIEEMLAVLYLTGEKTSLFDATKHWIKDWREEGFSEQLAQSIP